jgi:hypothetical protein
MNWLDRLFHRVPADQVRRDQLFEAERMVVEHQAAAEIHIALAGAYSARVMPGCGARSPPSQPR